MPAGHCVHSALPVVFLYVPATHAVQRDPVYPALHGTTHSLSNVLPAAEVLDAGQFVHSVLPLTDLYLPTSHCMHGPPASPVAPALQVQSYTVSLRACELAYSGQSWQASAVTAASDSEYLPAAQATHCEFADKFLYIPAGHCAHSVLFPEYPGLHTQSIGAEAPAVETACS